jgi:RHS repeat-associated protein
VTTTYLLDAVNPTGLPQVLDETVNGVVTRTYAYGLQRISENQQNGSTWTPSFYGYDGHGNVRFLTNSAGTVTDTYQYDAFGGLIASTGSTSNNFLYSGEWSDSIGLYNLRARYYNQATGRFWTRDPIEGQQCCGLSWNPYIYVKDNPVNATDPTGRDVLIENAFRYTQITLGATRTAHALAFCVAGLQGFVIALIQNPDFVGSTLPNTVSPIILFAGCTRVVYLAVETYYL